MTEKGKIIQIIQMHIKEEANEKLLNTKEEQNNKVTYMHWWEIITLRNGKEHLIKWKNKRIEVTKRCYENI